MTLIDKLINQLFPGRVSDNLEEKQVLLSEQIERNNVFLKDYRLWKEKEMHKGLLSHLSENIRIKKSNPEAEVNYFLYRDKRANGFYFHGEPPWNYRDYTFFVHHLIGILEKEGYHLNNAKREAIEEEQQLKVKEFFYLKPKLKYRIDTPSQQLYGNIMIEHRVVDEETYLIKLMANVYSDRNFYEPTDFEELMQKILLS